MGQMGNHILMTSEEYEKLTKGVFRVWTTICTQGISATSMTVLLNKEHWAMQEHVGVTLGIHRTSIQSLPFLMPQTLAVHVSQWFPEGLLAKITRLMLRNIFSLVGFLPILGWLVWYIRKGRYGVILCHHGGWPGGSFGRWLMLAGAIAGVPRRIMVIHSLPGPYRFGHAMFTRAKEWLTGRLATDIVTVSTAAKQALLQRSFSTDVKVIHNGVDISAVSDNRPEQAEKIRGKTIGFIGALTHYKGVQVLLEAFLRINEPCELLLVGPGDEKFMTLLQAKAQGATNPVTFMGYQEDVTSIYKNIDVFVMPSIAHESFGIVVLEAMAHRKPVICSDFGGMKEIVVNGETGLVVPAGNVEALTHAMNILLKDPTLCQRMGNMGFERASSHFSNRKMVEGYEALIKQR